MKQISVLVTVPPYADYLEEIARHPLVSGLRLNTVMPLREAPVELLRRLSALEKPLWVDLKGRQLRVVGAAIPPFTEIRLSHAIEVETPAEVFFSDGRERGRILGVQGDRIILEGGPRRLIGPGESVNIPHPSLRIRGFLTDTDREYLDAMKACGLRRVMLSFVESREDVEEIRSLIEDAEIIAKIESRRGLDFASGGGGESTRLMAARGDLYVEVARPHQIVRALKTIIRADPTAIAASRILESMADDPIPECSEIGDLAFLLEIGYRSFMFGDSLCFRKAALLEALNLFQAVVSEYR